MIDIRKKFAKETRTFEAHRGALVAQGGEGQWVAVKGRRLLGPFPKADVAWHAGIDTFGKPWFMLKQVFRVDKPLIVTQVRLDRLPRA